MDKKEFELKSKFTEDFFNEFQFDAEFRTIFDYMVGGMTPYMAIEHLCESKKELFKSFQEVVQSIPARMVVLPVKLKEVEDKFKYNTDYLPHPQSIETPGNDYYLVKVKGYARPMMAMYLEDEDGNEGWYENYCSKIIKEVVGWKDVSQ